MYQRLNDREARNKKTLGRKQVYLFRDENKPLFVEMRFSPEYKSLFEKTLKAFSHIPAKFVGAVQEIDRKKFIIRIDYLGHQLPVAMENLPKAAKLLHDLCRSGISHRRFEVPRYLLSLDEQFPELSVDMLIKRIKADTSLYLQGFGIDDPVMSNFTSDENGIYLVDLDHFSDNISLFYQIGFLIADVYLVTRTALPEEKDHIIGIAAGLISESSEYTPLLAGYISRLGIDVINEKRALDSYQGTESARLIRKMLGSFNS